MYKLIVFWQDGRKTIEKETYNPVELHGAPTISRNPQAISRIEIHDGFGCLETVWDARWPTRDRIT